MELKQRHKRWRRESAGLLIVPYGIETVLSIMETELAGLLIVPYGIETIPSHGREQKRDSFNRTLWN